MQILPKIVIFIRRHFLIQNLKLSLFSEKLRFFTHAFFDQSSHFLTKMRSFLRHCLWPVKEYMEPLFQFKVADRVTGPSGYLEAKIYSLPQFFSSQYSIFNETAFQVLFIAIPKMKINLQMKHKC